MTSKSELETQISTLETELKSTRTELEAHKDIMEKIGLYYEKSTGETISNNANEFVEQLKWAIDDSKYARPLRQLKASLETNVAEYSRLLEEDTLRLTEGKAHREGQKYSTVFDHSLNYYNNMRLGQSLEKVLAELPRKEADRLELETIQKIKSANSKTAAALNNYLQKVSEQGTENEYLYTLAAASTIPLSEIWQSHDANKEIVKYLNDSIQKSAETFFIKKTQTESSMLELAKLLPNTDNKTLQPFALRIKERVYPIIDRLERCMGNEFVYGKEFNAKIDELYSNKPVNNIVIDQTVKPA